MLRLELRNALVTTALWMTVPAVLPVAQVIMTGSFGVSSFLTFYCGFLAVGYWVAIQLGIDAFRRERDDHAFEYILAAPLSRSKLLFQKLAPRVFVLGVLALCVLGFSVALEIGDAAPLLEQDMPRFLHASRFFPYVCILFAVGFSLSLLGWGNGRLAVTAAIPPAWLFVSWLSDTLLSPWGLSILGPVFMLGALGLFFFSCWQARVGRRPLAFLRRNGGPASPTSLPLSWREQRRRQKAGLLAPEIARLWRAELISWWPLLLIPILYRMRITVNDIELLSDPLPVTIVFMGLIILARSFLHGFHLFRQEFRDHSLEYLLAAPLSIDSIILQKLAARILVLLPGIAVFMTLLALYRERVILVAGPLLPIVHPACFVIGMILALVSGVLLSPFEQKGVQALVSLAFFYAIVLPPLALGRLLSGSDLELTTPLRSFALASSGLLLSIVILGPAFLAARKRFDLLAPSRYTRRSGLLVLLPLAGLAVVSGVVLAFS